MSAVECVLLYCALAVHTECTHVRFALSRCTSDDGSFGQAGPHRGGHCAHTPPAPVVILEIVLCSSQRTPILFWCIFRKTRSERAARAGRVQHTHTGSTFGPYNARRHYPLRAIWRTRTFFGQACARERSKQTFAFNNGSGCFAMYATSNGARRSPSNKRVVQASGAVHTYDAGNHKRYLLMRESIC